VKDFARQARPPLWLTVVGALAALTTLIPLIYIAVRAFGGGFESLAELIVRPRIGMLVWNTITLGISVTLAATLTGIITAFVLARCAIASRRMWIIFATIPLAVPSYLAAYGLLAAFPTIQGFWGSWMVLVAVTTPYVTLPVAAALRAGTTDFDDLSRTLGAPAWKALGPGTWHQIRGASLAGALLVFLYTIADFGGVALFRFPVLTTAIQQAYGASYDRSLAAVLSVILVTLAFIIVFFERKARGRLFAPTASSRSRLRLIPITRRNIWMFAFVLAPTVIGALIPISVMIIRMFDVNAWDQLEWGKLLSATANTVMLSFSGATVGLLLALPIGLLAGRYRSRIVSVIESLGYLPLALPGIVVGLALVLFALTTVPALYQTAFLLACAYGLLFMPKAVGSLRNAVSGIPQSLNDVSASLGYTTRQRLSSVYLPLTRSSLLVAWLLIAVTAMKELPATLMLRPTGMDTLATVLWAKTDVASYGAAAPYALMLVVVAAIPALLLSRSDSMQEVK
jgi:iron(III) transport system permease protein